MRNAGSLYYILKQGVHWTSKVDLAVVFIVLEIVLEIVFIPTLQWEKQNQL